MPAFAFFVAALALLAVAPRLALAAQGEPEKGASSFEYFHAFAMDAEGRTLFLGAHFGLLRSEDGGLSWRRVTLPSKRPHLDVMAVAPDPKDATVVYVATHEAGVFKSTDGGRSWAEANTGLGGLDVHGLAVDPKDTGTLYAAVVGSGEGVYRTTDRGRKWSRLARGPEGEVKVLAAVYLPTGMGGTQLYAGTTEGLQRSEGHFGEWRPVGALPLKRTVRGFAMSPSDPAIMYVILEDEILKSTDSGKMWSSVGQGAKNLGAIAVNPKRHGEAYVISNDGAIFKTTDGGVTWERLKERTVREEIRG